MNCMTSRWVSNPNCAAAIWLHHSMRPSASSKTMPLGEAWSAAKISCSRSSLCLTCAWCWRNRRRVRSAASPHMPKVDGVTDKSPNRSHRNTRAPRHKSPPNHNHAATAAPSAAPQGPSSHQPTAPPASCQARKYPKRQNMRTAQLSVVAKTFMPPTETNQACISAGGWPVRR